MLRWAATFFLLSLIFAVLGFGGYAREAAGIAKISFILFLVLGVLSLVSEHMSPKP